MVFRWRASNFFFDNIKEFPWLLEKFPDFFPDLEKLSFFPDFSLTVAMVINWQEPSCAGKNIRFGAAS
mgnify:CR=1 FL=1